MTSNNNNKEILGVIAILEHKRKPMPAIKIISHKGHDIVYIDYRGLNEEEMLNLAKSLREHLLSNPQFHLRLVNITNIAATRKFTSFIRQLGRETKHIPVKAAIVGITGAKKVLLASYNKLLGGAMRPFENEDAAKEYLVS